MTDGTGPGSPPTPDGVATYDDLVAALQQLRIWAGVSYRELHRRVARSRRERGIPEIPVVDTVHRALQPGRRRLDVELVVDIATALLGDTGGAAAWRQAWSVVAGSGTAAGIVTVSEELPPAHDHFTGRTLELAGVLEAAVRKDGLPPVVALEGMGGIGKTTLATHAAHRLVRTGLYPDGQLVVNLRGFDDTLPPVEPAAVLGAFLRSLGVPGSQLAGLDLSARRTRFRDLMSGRRVLILLDNAASAEQVAPLLPATSSCVVLVTSRRTLEEVATARTRLTTFSTQEALAVLRASVGSERIEAELSSAVELIELVGALPLAIDLVAARISATPSWSLADHVARLQDAREHYHLEHGVEVALRSSYRGIGEDHRTLLRALALHAGTTFDAYTAAALGGAVLTATQQLLDDLVEGCLLVRDADRFEMHDLVRTFAIGRAYDEDPSSVRRAAIRRSLATYGHAAHAAALLHTPEAATWMLEPQGEPGATPSLADADEAAAWFGSEWTNLISSGLQALDEGCPDVAAQIVLAVLRYLDVAGHTEATERLLEEVAQATDGLARARCLTALVLSLFPQARYADAERPLLDALEEYRHLGDASGESAVLNNLGLVYQNLGRAELAADMFGSAATLAVRIGDAGREMRPLLNLGEVAAQLGRDDEALAHLRRADTIAAGLGDPARRTETRLALGELLLGQGRLEEARVELDHAGVLAAQTGFTELEVYVLSGLGTVHAGLGASDVALAHHERARSTARDAGLTRAEIDALMAYGETLVDLGLATLAVDLFTIAAERAAEAGSVRAETAAREALADAQGRAVVPQRP
ncbi:ATP-binding protein [Nocardioides stalactiti]|uniref:ATP-binding protein n=1 Tax=Nocardioides stalactiti TaxID=2755356 RepID=UPI00160474A5|nr:tetratricopeptide repeat protein [Nocardioides stalactiti]